MFRKLGWLALSSILLLVGPGVVAEKAATNNNGPAPLDQAAERMTLPDGFHATLFAGEPEVVQPIAMAFDDKGRLWVVECLSYPKWRADGTGNDRVVILEDTTGDGRHDKRTVFLDDGSNLSGIEIGFGGVWLCSLPNLIYVPVKPGEDKPAGPPEIVLDGWNLKETRHNVFNSLAWGPDGWLYGCNGIQAKSHVGNPGTPQDQRVYFDCGVWKYHPVSKKFEVVAWGTTNPFGLDWDEHGQGFITNCVIDHLWHFLPGAHWQRMYGEDPNPYVYEPMRAVNEHKHWAGGHWTSSRSIGNATHPDHSDFGGGHAHSGCSVYLGDNFPDEYRNTVFMCNLHGNRLNRDTLKRQGSGYVGGRAPDFLFANDPWFRGICVKYGPDGGLYVSDWCDTGECHNYDVADTSNGRIYKVVYGKPKPWQGDLNRLSDSDLIGLHHHKNEWFVRKARRILQERAAAQTLEPTATEHLKEMARSARMPTVRLRALWTGYCVGAFTEQELAHFLQDSFEPIRAWAVLLSAEKQPNPDPEMLAAWAKRAGAEESPFVRSHWASIMQRVSNTARAQLAKALITRPEDQDDHNLTMMYWFGVQPLVTEQPDTALQLIDQLAVPVVREFMVRCYLSRPGADFGDSFERLVGKLAAIDSGTVQRDFLAGILSSLEGRKERKQPEQWTAVYSRLAESNRAEVRRLAEAVAVRLGDEKVTRTLLDRLNNPEQQPEDRLAALDLLLPERPQPLGEILLSLLPDKAVRKRVIQALAAYPNPKTANAILEQFGSFNEEEKADAVQTLASRPAFAISLLRAVEAGQLPREAISPFTARQLQALKNPEVNQLLEKAWGTVRPASQTHKQQAVKYKQLLTKTALNAANPQAGKVVFTRVCANCHKLFGEGGDVGPELTGSQRANIDYILENVLDPSAVVPGEYRMTAFQLLDGRTITGIVRRETPQSLTVRTLNEELVVAKNDIDERQQTRLSIMPDGLFENLSDEEILNLVRYLSEPKPLDTED